MAIKLNTNSLLNKKLLWHLLFWSVLLIYFLSVSWPYEKNKIFLTEAVSFEFILKIIIAYSIIHLFIPHLLNKNRKVLFFISTLAIIYTAFITYSAFKYYYLVPTYPELFINRPPFILADRFTKFPAIIGSIPTYLFPTIILVVFNYYKKQKDVATLLEQKKTSELNALKNQLNPHFLFNTLNNLYALALKKSDKTPEVIAKLSEILDYILYQCKGNFVPLKNEIALLHNYIALEKIRYGDRVDIVFNEDIKSDQKTAPLLLLTFLENAFKHGVSQELNTARIELSITADENLIDFSIENTKPSNSKNRKNSDRDGIGLQNIRKQLDLLYPNNYKLDIKDTSDLYSVILKITPNEV
tara:strand:- start:371 stop:1438 length:1068 start_codon:yes stop_codon:yes gene_type:complete